MPSPSEIKSEKGLDTMRVKQRRRHFTSQTSLTPESQQWRPVLVSAWLAHFVISILVLCYGCTSNHGER